MTPIRLLWDRVVLGINLKHPRNWRNDVLNLAEIDAWDRDWRRRLGAFAGLSWFRRTNVRTNWTIVSRHWPHKLCWDWSVSFGLWRRGYDRVRIGVIFAREFRSVQIFLLFAHVHVAWQNYGYMAGLGPYQKGAPTVRWGHHLKHMPPANNLAA